MRLKLGDHEVEGTAEEIAALLSLLSPTTSPPTPPAVPASAPPAQDRNGGPSPFITEDRAYSALTRRPLGVTHTTLLRILYQAGERWTSAPDLQSALGLSTREFAGLLGAFGKRVAGTEGEGSQTFFDQYWDHINGYNLYRLPPSVRVALRRAGVV